MKPDEISTERNWYEFGFCPNFMIPFVRNLSAATAALLSSVQGALARAYDIVHTCDHLHTGAASTAMTRQFTVTPKMSFR